MRFPGLRRAIPADEPAIARLIAASARELGQTDYTSAQIEGALRGAFGVDTQLIRDGSYFVVESEGRLAGCGGWSRRRTLFGGDARAGRDASVLDPAVDAAKIRAFFVHPEYARRGIGSALLERCEAEAMAYGFSRLEMMATLPGVRLYAARGYVAEAQIRWPLGDGLEIELAPMTKRAAASRYTIARAKPDDAAGILALQKLAYESEARVYDDWTLPPLVQTLEALRAEFADSVVLGAVEGMRLVGSVRARFTEGVCHIGRLIVHPQWQGHGLGTALMRRIEREFPHSHRFELFTGSRSAGNIRLYERLGFVRVREKTLSPAVTLVYLEKHR